MKKVLAEIRELERKLAVDYNDYRKQHPKTKKTQSDPLFKGKSPNKPAGKSKPFNKSELFDYDGSYEDFPEGSDRYYAQLAVDHHGASVRDNSQEQLVAIGKKLDNEPNDEEHA